MNEENKPNKLQIFQINRKKVYQGLAIAGALSLLAYCTNVNLARMAEDEALLTTYNLF